MRRRFSVAGDEAEEVAVAEQSRQPLRHTREDPAALRLRDRLVEVMLSALEELLEFARLRLALQHSLEGFVADVGVGHRGCPSAPAARAAQAG